MVGYGGTGKSGHQYHYYNCKKARKKQCRKKIVGKQYIEDKVIDACLGLLTEENIAFIAKAVADECGKSEDTLSIKELKKAVKEANEAIENLWRGIETGQAADMLTERIHQRQAEKADLEEQLAIEENKRVYLSEAQIRAFLDYVRRLPKDDIRKRRAIINIFVHSVYLYDDHFTLIINASRHPLSEKDIPLDDIESKFEGDSEGCSSMMTSAPPVKTPRNLLISRSFLIILFSLSAGYAANNRHSNSPAANAFLSCRGFERIGSTALFFWKKRLSSTCAVACSIFFL